MATYFPSRAATASFAKATEPAAAHGRRRAALTFLLLLFGWGTEAADGPAEGRPVALMETSPESFPKDLRKLVDGRKVKLLALQRKTGAPHIIDLENLTARTLGPDRRCDRPHWHPNGRDIVYSTRAAVVCTIDEDGGGREVLDFKGRQARWWFDPGTGEPQIVYTSRETKGWYHKGQGEGYPTFLQRIGEGEKTKLLDFSFDGGLSFDGSHLAEAYGGLYLADLESGKVHTLNGGKQACNASISPDNTYRVMYLQIPHKYFGIRDETDRLLWQLDCPDGYFEWQTPRFSTHPDFAACTVTRSPMGPYRICIVRIRDRAVLPVPMDGDWAAPMLWVEGGPRPDLGRKGWAFDGGPAPAGMFASLKLKRFGKQAEAIERADKIAPLVRRLLERKAVLDPEARAEIDAIMKAALAFGRKQLREAAAEEESNPKNARLVYEAVASRFAGLDPGAAAGKRLKDAGFRREVAAWPAYEEMRAEAGRLRDVPGARPSWKDDRYRARNEPVMAMLAVAFRELNERYPGTLAARRAVAILEKYGIQKGARGPSLEALGKTIRLTGVIEKASPTPSLTEIQPYESAVSCFVYRVEKVLSGDYKRDRILVAHWCLRNRIPQPAKDYEAGDRHRLTVDLFELHKELKDVPESDETEAFDLAAYWAIETEAPENK